MPHRQYFRKLKMKFKILADFQTQSKLYLDNAYYQLPKHSEPAEIIERPYFWQQHTNKFYFWKYITLDTSGIDIADRCIFPIFWDRGSVILPDVIAFVQQHRAAFEAGCLIPVFLDPLEGTPGVSESVEQFVKAFDYKIPAYLISGDYQLSQKSHTFHFIYNDQWQHHIVANRKPISYTAIKTYINLNRVARYHRCALMEKLIANDLVDVGYNTWADTYGGLQEYLNQIPDSQIPNQKFKTLDIEDVSTANPTKIVPIEHCKQSFVYLATETHVDADVLFISEKTYKPISIGMPFITLGNPGTLELLRTKGYITFNKWFDENYDLDIPLASRIDIIVNNLKWVNSLSNFRRIVLREEMFATCQHNLEVYKQYQHKNSFLEAMHTVINRTELK
jgi:hypothetical protein